MTKLLSLINNVFDHPDFGKFLLRLTFGGLLLFHGWFKVVNGVDWIGNMIQSYGLPSFLAYGVYLGEVIAPILLILGVLTRISALIIAGNMVVAWLLVDMQHTFTITAVGAWGLELLALFFFGALAIAFLGAGKISLAHNSKWQ